MGRTRREGDDLDDDFVPDKGDEDFYGLGKGALSNESDEETSDEEREDKEDEGENEGKNEDEDEDEDEYGGEDNVFDLAEYFTDEEVNGGSDQDEPEESTITSTTKRLLNNRAFLDNERTSIHFPLSFNV